MPPTRETEPSPDRRRFLRTVALAAGAALLDWPAWAGVERSVVPRLARWFPRIPVPREILVVPFAADTEEGMVLESAAGLAAARVLDGKWNTLVYEEGPTDGYRRWFEDYCRAHELAPTRLSLDELVVRMLHAQIAQGYLLYRFEKSDRPLHSAGKLDESANVATSLAAAKNALTVSERLAKRMEKLGLKRILDVRDRTEAWCLAQNNFSRSVLGTADPKTRNARSLMIALNAFVCSGRGDVHEKALARCDDDSPILGWGCEAEDHLVIPASRWGLFQTATNWCHSLPVFASDTVTESVPATLLLNPRTLHWSALDWGDGIHHVNFTMTDGDNVQWIMGNFTDGHDAPYYFGNSARGRIPFTWGLPVPSLCQLSPRTLADIFAKAKPNDDFMQFHAGGYFYPDLFGKARGTTKALESHATRLRSYMDLTDVRMIAFNFQDWNSADARKACEIFAAILPGLLGIFAFQYYPYSAGNGSIYWLKGAGNDDVPVVSCRFTIWAQTGRPHDSTPAAVAAQLNRLPIAGEKVNENCFSWVLAHAWSRFRRAEKGAPLDAEEKDVPQDKDTPDSVRGYEPVLWAAERLAPMVRPVTSLELLLRVRLRLRPRETLSRWLAEVEAAKGVAKLSDEASGKLGEARLILAGPKLDATAARRCFELLKQVHSAS